MTPDPGVVDGNCKKLQRNVPKRVRRKAVAPKISAPKLYVCQLYVWLERKRLMCVRENNSFGSATYAFHSLLDDIMTAGTVNNR